MKRESSSSSRQILLFSFQLNRSGRQQQLEEMVRLRICFREDSFEPFPVLEYSGPVFSGLTASKL